ncbi:MAG: PilZ domain-containing protein, partial [Fimbriimonadales bacterium]
VEALRPNMLAQAILMVGGAPRKLTVLVTPESEKTVHITPVSSVQLCERRRRKRYPVNMLVDIEVDGMPVSAQVVNLSISGLGFHTPQAMEVGQEFTVSLPLLGKEEALQARAQVRHRRKMPNELWYIGAAFMNLSRADELWLRKLFP